MWRRIWIGTTTVIVLLTGLICKYVLAEPTNFEILKSNVVYYGRDTKIVDPVTQFRETGQNGETFEFERFQHGQVERQSNHQHHKHYRKGNVKVSQEQRDSDIDRDASRQGRNCPGVCRFVPDRDFCPTNVVEEFEAYEEEYEDEEYYSEENSVEDSEGADDYYSDEEYDEDDEKNEVKRSEPALERTSSLEGRDGKNIRPVYGPPHLTDSSSLYIVYPELTKYAIGRNQTQSLPSKSSVKPRSKLSNRNGTTVKRRQRERRLRQRSRGQFAELIRLRPPALEQEILIRWDRVVERGPYIGGDIVLPDGVALRQPNFRFSTRIWPKGMIPYKMDQSLNTCRINTIYDAMDEIESKTCIRFVERDTERNYIDIRRTSFGCSSYVGMLGGAQNLSLSTGCFSKFTVTHELIHAIGFDHEQSRKDRDKYVDIDFDNVIREKGGQFRLEPGFTGSGLPYDIRSIMHYSAFLFAKDKCEPTIYPVNEKIDLCELGAGNGKGGMTDCDAAKINKLYNCGKKYSQKCKIKRGKL